MFDLEQAISDWRRQMLAAGIKTPVPLEELESHLREDVEQQTQSGVPAQVAFDDAVQRIGQSDGLRTEFAKVRGPNETIERMKRVVLILAGIPNLSLATNMNTSNSNPNIEPAWATYLKAVGFAAPAVLLWLFSVAVLMPKLYEICSAAGITVRTVYMYGKPPLIVWISVAISQVMILLTAHGTAISGAAVVAFALLEWRSRRWPRYRRAVLGVGIFLFNLAVLLSITLMVLNLIVANQTLMQHAK